VNFDANCAESEIEEVFENLGIWGTKVSTIMNKYAVEVPAGDEENFLDKFEDHPLVARAYEDYLKAKKPKPRKKQE
jgi:hypothetical protein